MKRIVLCGSRKFKDDIISLGETLKNKGYEVVVPKEFFVPMSKKEHSMLHFSEITNKKTDCVLIVNKDKGEIKNYIGPNSFAEVAMAFFHGKKVFLLNDIYNPYQDELVGWEVIPLKGNLEEMYKILDSKE